MVRQGNPLSPLIFVLTVDMLQSIFNEAMRSNLIHVPIPMGPKHDLHVIHYADDTILVTPDAESQIMESITTWHILLHK